MREANRYFDAAAPWTLKKTDPERMASVLYTVIETVRRVTLILQPVMPESTAKLLDLVGQPANKRDFAALKDRLVSGTSLPKPEGVFPRYVEAEA